MEPRVVNNILKKNADFLSRHLVLSPSVLDKLRENGLITDVVRRQIIFQEQCKQVPTLIRSLENRGLLTLRKFLNVLKETGHSWLVDTILDTEAFSYEDVTTDRSLSRDRVARSRFDRRTPPDVSWRPVAKPPPPPPPPPVHMSLGTLLSERRKAEEGSSEAIRGQLHPKTILEDTLSRPMQFMKPNNNSFHGEVPGALINLQGYFKDQRVTNEQTLSVLKQEEVAIRELLEQNGRDQVKLQRNQHALNDIGHRLEEINLKATDVYNPADHAQLSRYRLAQLNQIPWSSDK